MSKELDEIGELVVKIETYMGEIFDRLHLLMKEVHDLRRREIKEGSDGTEADKGD